MEDDPRRPLRLRQCDTECDSREGVGGTAVPARGTCCLNDSSLQNEHEALFLLYAFVIFIFYKREILFRCPLVSKSSGIDVGLP